MNPALSNLAIMLIMMQVSKKIDMEDPTNKFYIRILYVSATALTFAIYLYTQYIIKKKNDLTTLKFVNPPNTMAGETEGKLEVTTVRDYDLKQVNAAIKGMYSGIAMMAFMHLYMKYTNPLIMQSISPVKSALESNIVQIHIFNKPATDDLKRPFKAASLFGGFGGAQEAKTDKKSIEAAEKAGLKQE